MKWYNNLKHPKHTSALVFNCMIIQYLLYLPEQFQDLISSPTETFLTFQQIHNQPIRVLTKNSRNHFIRWRDSSLLINTIN